MRPGSSTYFAPGMRSAMSLPELGRDHGVVGVMEDECRDADSGKQRPHVHVDRQSHHVSKGPWACRQAFVPCPGCPNFLVPRHVRIREMRSLPRAPRGGRGSSELLGCGSLGAFRKRIRIALEHDQRGCAGWICGCEQRRFRNVPSIATRTASPLPRSSSTAVMLSARSSKVCVAGSDTPVPSWSKKTRRPSDVIASNQPWIYGSSGKTSQFVNGGETNTMSRSPSCEVR